MKTPGGKTILSHRRRKPSKARCSVTGEVLPGVPQANPTNLRKMTKSQRRPERPFGGVLSGKAMRSHFRAQARSIEGGTEVLGEVLAPGRVAVKLAGRDAGKKCVIVDVLDNNYVLIDGEVRRRKVNVSHLELLPQKVDVAKGAETSALKAVFDELGFTVRETTPKKAAPRPRRVRKKKEVATVSQKERRKAKKAQVEAVEKKIEAAVEKTEVEKAPEAKPAEAKPEAKVEQPAKPAEKAPAYSEKKE